MYDNPFADQTDNPYKPPVADSEVVGLITQNREDLRAVAVYQKGIIICILLYLILVVAQLLLPVLAVPNVQILAVIVAFSVLGLGVAGTVFVFLLSTKVYGAAVGIVLGILTLVPCVGLVVLLIINGQATNVLRQNGIQVGLLGADLSQV